MRNSRAPRARASAAPLRMRHRRDTADTPARARAEPLQLVPQSFYRRDAREVAPQLLNKILLAHDGSSGRIVEVEAYCGAIDPAAHSYRGKTARNATMFGPPGHMYVYFTYGMHWCCNTVCAEEGDGSGVLLRALAPLAGIEQMRERRHAVRRDRDLCSGPGRLTQAMGINGVHDGIELFSGRAPFCIVSDGTAPPARLDGRARVGISRGQEHLWRWYVEDSEHVSKR